MRMFVVILAVGPMIAFTQPAVTRAEPITQIFAFGDSLSDTGNVFLLTSQLTPDDVIPQSPPFFEGRFSNGPVWVERLAQRLGQEVAPGLIGGTNFAFGGAETGTGLSWRGSVNIGSQIQAYVNDNPAPAETDLFVVWGGANDVLRQFDGGGPFDPSLAAANLFESMATLHGHGARRFLVGDLPPLGQTPWLQLLGMEAEADRLTVEFNAALAAELDRFEHEFDAVVHRLDAYALFEQVMADPPRWGLTNVTDSALDELSGQIVDNPEEYLYWDDVHPTATVHRIIADRAARILAIPEPTTGVMLAVAIILLAVVGRRGRTGVFSLCMSIPGALILFLFQSRRDVPMPAQGRAT